MAFASYSCAPGTYDISAEASRFKKFLRSGLVLSVSQNANLDIQLELGSLSGQVTDLPLLDSVTVDRGAVLRGQS